MTGVTEEIGETARSIIKVLDAQPFALAMIVTNLILLGYLWFTQIENNRAWTQNNEQRAELGRLVLKSAQETQQLFASIASSKCFDKP
jgi:hypothetical protein